MYRANNKRIKKATQLLQDGEVGVRSFLIMVSSSVQTMVDLNDVPQPNEDVFHEEQLLGTLSGEVPADFRTIGKFFLIAIDTNTHYLKVVHF